MRYTDRGNWYYEVLEPGFKYNLSDLQSAVGIHQLRKLEGFLAARREYVRYYHERFGRLEEVEIPPGDVEGGHAWHLYILRLRLEKLRIGRGEFMEELRRRGVGASVHFIPVPLHPAFRALAAEERNACPRALALYERIVTLPLYPAMTWGMVERVADAVEEVVRAWRR
jgi:dTDP-4-amino-4,6-dideoxygalactose transaminase